MFQTSLKNDSCINVTKYIGERTTHNPIEAASVIPSSTHNDFTPGSSKRLNAASP